MCVLCDRNNPAPSHPSATCRVYTETLFIELAPKDVFLVFPTVPGVGDNLPVQQQYLTGSLIFRYTTRHFPHPLRCPRFVSGALLAQAILCREAWSFCTIAFPPLRRDAIALSRGVCRCCSLPFQWTHVPFWPHIHQEAQGAPKGLWPNWDLLPTDPHPHSNGATTD